MSLSKLVSLFTKRHSTREVERPVQEWALTSKDIRHWRSAASKHSLELLLHNHLSKNNLYIGPNTFITGFILVLHQACISGCVNIVQYIVDCHANQFDVNQPVLYHPLPFRYFTTENEMDIQERKAHRKNSLLHAAAEGGSIEILNLLVAKGASVNALDCCLKNPLMVALKHGNANAVKYLLASGANVNSQDKDGVTPLMYAVRYLPDYISSLLEAGGNPNIKNHSEYTVVHDTVLNRNMLGLERLFVLGISPILTGESSVPCALFLADYHHIDKNAYRTKEIHTMPFSLQPILNHQDCPPEHKVDYILLEATCQFYLYNVGLMRKECNEVIEKLREALEARKALNLPVRFQAPIKAYQGQREIENFEDLNRFSCKSKDTIIELAFQCLIIRERCLGYGDITVITFLFQIAKWMLSDSFTEAAFLLFQCGSEMLISRMTSASTSQLYTLQGLIASGVYEVYKHFPSVNYVYDSQRLTIYDLTSDVLASILMPTLCNFIECQRLSIELDKQRHSHSGTDKNFQNCEYALLKIVYILYTSPVKGMDAELLGKELILKCPKFIGLTGWPTTVLETSITDRYIGERFIQTFLEWGASEFINDVGTNGFRPVLLAYNTRIRELLLNNGAHPDAAFLSEIYPHQLEIPLPRRLACLAASVIIWEAIPYQDLEIAPRIKKFIAMHDPVDIKLTLKEELGSLI